MNNKKHIVIIGAGFAGLRVARMLNNHSSYRVTLIDKNNYHQFQPLLYQVATANLDASNISFPVRAIFRKSKNVRILIGEVEAISPERSEVEIADEQIVYDYLVIATGATTNYFGNKNMKNLAFPMKSTTEALQLKNQLIRNLEDAATSKNTAAIRKLLSIVIVGGGPTGIELSGAFAEIKNDTLPKEYPELRFKDMKIYLLEGNDRVLGTMSYDSSLHSKRYLEKMGVEVKTNTLVKDYDGSRVLLQNGEVIESALVIWTAGVKAIVPDGIDERKIEKDGRIRVDVFNRLIDSNNVFVLGDAAFVTDNAHPKGVPQLASVAIDQAKHLVLNFKRLAKGKKMKEYKYHNKGSMATVGRNKAVVDFIRPRISLQGFTAWLLWMSVHLFLLIGFKNRIIVFINWVTKYFTRNQSLSLLFPAFLRKTGIKQKEKNYEMSSIH